MAVGLPELPTLLRRVNPNPYLFIESGIDRYIEAREPGGIAGFVERIRASAPSAVASGPTEGAHLPLLDPWLREGYRLEKVGPWQIYFRRSTTDDLDVPILRGN